MKRATFGEGVIVALVSSIIIAAVFSLLSSFYLGAVFLKLLIAGIAFGYILYLLLKTSEHVGSVISVLLWFVITLVAMIFSVSIIDYMLVQLVLIWLLRSLYYYNSLFSSLCDLALVILSIIIAYWAWTNTSSLFLTSWCFFLIQSLFVFIPENILAKNKNSEIKENTIDKFEYAYQSAEAAAEKLFKKV